MSENGPLIPTLNNPHKNKETQFARYELAKAGVGVTPMHLLPLLSERRREENSAFDMKRIRNRGLVPYSLKNQYLLI